MNHEEHLKIELSALFEEYRQLKSEIVSNLESGRQVANLTLTSAGILIATIPYIVQSQATLLFLVAPMFFYLLAWAQLRYVYLVLDMGVHLRETVVPRIQGILKELSSSKQERDFAEIMSWELAGKSPIRLRRSKILGLLFVPIAGANYALPLLAAVLSLSTFLFVRLSASPTITLLEIGLIVIDVVGFIYSAFWGLQAELRR